MADFAGFYAWRSGSLTVNDVDFTFITNERGPLSITTGDNNLTTLEQFTYDGTTYYLRGPLTGVSQPGFLASTQPDGFGEQYFFSKTDQFNVNDDVSAVGYNPNADFLVCFLPGTLIGTPGGDRPVETLAIGDPVLTADGRTVPVRWIGRQTVASLFMPATRRPVAIAPGALGDGLPARQLRVTADHALLIDGVLVNAGALVNGTTIRRLAPDELGATFTVFHVETADHEIVLAEGCPVETFVDNVTRGSFDNFAEYLALYGREAPVRERPEPRALSARQVPRAIRARIEAAGGILSRAA